MTQTITIKIYPTDYGYGRIIARYDSGNTDDELKKCSFDRMEDALAWAGRMAAVNDNADKIKAIYIDPPYSTGIKDEIQAINRQGEVSDGRA